MFRNTLENRQTMSTMLIKPQYVGVKYKIMGLCKYKDIFGKPGQGIHRHRVLDISIMDVFTTILVGGIIGYAIRWFVPWWNIPATIGGAFLLGIVLHRAFCVRTTVDKWLFPNVVDS